MLNNNRNYNRLGTRSGRYALLAAVLNMNRSARTELGVAKDTVPHHEMATPNHERFLAQVMAEAQARRERRAILRGKPTAPPSSTSTAATGAQNGVAA